MSDNPFNEDYFLRGQETGVSNYTNYRWLPKLTIPMARAIIKHLGATEHDAFLDFGCATGCLIKALSLVLNPKPRMDRPSFCGVEISDWARENSVTGYGIHECLDAVSHRVEFVISKDVLEHLDIFQIKAEVPRLLGRCRKKALFIVPLKDPDSRTFVREEDRADKTHRTCFTLTDWMDVLYELAPDFIIEGSYYLEGIKPAALEHPGSTGFFTLTRIK